MCGDAGPLALKIIITLLRTGKVDQLSVRIFFDVLLTLFHLKIILGSGTFKIEGRSPGNIGSSGRDFVWKSRITLFTSFCPKTFQKCRYH